VNCVLTDVTGITPGMTAIVQSQGDASFNGNFQIESDHSRNWRRWNSGMAAAR
jgi:hypothetical protein